MFNMWSEHTGQIIELIRPSEDVLQQLSSFPELRSLLITGGDTYIFDVYDVISTFPVNICDLTNLGSLEISHTCLGSIPAEIGRLQNLKTLFLNNNAITYIDPQLWTLQGLEILNLRNNELIIIPAEVANMSSLRQIVLYEVSDLQIDPAICNLDLELIAVSPGQDLHPDVLANVYRIEYGAWAQMQRILTRIFEHTQTFTEPDYESDEPEERNTFVHDTFPEDNPLANECSVCDTTDNLLVSGCRHVMCIMCLNRITTMSCPVCRKVLDEELIKRKK